MSQQVLPGLDMTDTTDIRLVNPKHFGQRCLSHVSLCSDKEHIGPSEPGTKNSFSDRLSSALNLFSVVVGIISWMQMNWLTTNRTITPVKNVRLIFCSRLVIKKTMGHSVGEVMYPVDREYSISVSIGRSGPIPASFSKRIGKRRVTRHIPCEDLRLVHVCGSSVSSPTQWITVSPPSCVVGHAPPFGPSRFATARNRTHTPHDTNGEL